MYMRAVRRCNVALRQSAFDPKIEYNFNNIPSIRRELDYLDWFFKVEVMQDNPSPEVYKQSSPVWEFR